ncbi:hypothetical protein [Streptomyces sp. NPDC047315]|uniref:hypothetical protein n=1 Tax=Streptomyces sp. NPDC047315 TaxID=3155142 RepID=UPI0033FFA2E5
MLVTARAVTVHAEVTPYAVRFESWEQFSQYELHHIGRTALSVSRAVLLPIGFENPWYGYHFSPSTNDASCTLTATGWRPVDADEYHHLTTDGSTDVVDRRARLHAEDNAHTVFDALQRAGVTVDGTAADLRADGVLLTLG